MADSRVGYPVWLGIEIAVWQAAALTLGIDPDKMHRRSEWQRPGFGPRFEESSFPNRAIKKEFWNRVQLVEALLSDRIEFKAGARPKTLAFHKVQLRQVVAWLQHRDCKSIPRALLAAIKREAVPAVAVVTPPAVGQPSAFVKKQRWDDIDRDIEVAYEMAASKTVADVFLQLKNRFLDGTTLVSGGTVRQNDGSLQYTDSSNKIKYLSKKALGDRLRRRAHTRQSSINLDSAR